MTSLIADSKEPDNVSLAAFRPTRIKEFIVDDDEGRSDVGFHGGSARFGGGKYTPMSLQ